MKSSTVAQRLRRQNRDERNARRRGHPTGLYASVTVIAPRDWESSRWKRDRVARPGGKKPRP